MAGLITTMSRQRRAEREELGQFFQALDSALANIECSGILFDCKKEEFGGRVEDALGTLKIIIEWCNLQNDQTNACHEFGLEPHRPFPITCCCQRFLCTITRYLFTRGLGLLIKKVREKYFADAMSFMFIGGLLFSGV